MKVSVLVTTYNHDEFVEDAVESVLAQRPDFDFEVVLCDDASTDRTPALLEGFAGREPTRVRYLASDSNVGMTQSLRRGLRACRGELVAILEGDDYWISPHKLKSQADFLDRNPQCSFNFTGLLLLTEGDMLRPFNLLERTEFTTQELIANNFIANFSTCMYRRSLLARLPSALFDTYSADWIFNIAMSMHGPIGCVPQQMVAYRNQGQGSWAGMAREDQLATQIELIDEYDAILDHRFTEEFDQLKRRLGKKLERQRYFGLLSQGKRARAARHYPGQFTRSLLSVARSALVPPALAELGSRRAAHPGPDTETLVVPRIR